MIITVKPSDLIKRCLWTDYKRFCLCGIIEEDIDKLIEEDSPFTLSEDDAYVIGLLKVVETNNLVHRYKMHIDEVLKVKSNLFDNKLYINKNIILAELKDFRNRFPSSFKASFEYKIAIEDLIKYIDKMLIEIENLKIYKKILNEKTYIFVSSNDIKDMISN